jgi:hypothetical protein
MVSYPDAFPFNLVHPRPREGQSRVTVREFPLRAVRKSQNAFCLFLLGYDPMPGSTYSVLRIRKLTAFRILPSSSNFDVFN